MERSNFVAKSAAQRQGLIFFARPQPTPPEIISDLLEHQREDFRKKFDRVGRARVRPSRWWIGQPDTSWLETHWLAALGRLHPSG